MNSILNSKIIELMEIIELFLATDSLVIQDVMRKAFFTHQQPARVSHAMHDFGQFFKNYSLSETVYKDFIAGIPTARSRMSSNIAGSRYCLRSVIDTSIDLDLWAGTGLLEKLIRVEETLINIFKYLESPPKSNLTLVK